MVPHGVPFRNALTRLHPPAGRRAWAAWQPRRCCPYRMATWCTVGLVGDAHLQQPLHPACRTHARLSVSLLHVHRTDPILLHPVACLWWTLRAVSQRHDHVSTRCCQSHAPGMAAACPGAADCCAVILLEPKDVVYLVSRTYWRRTHVPTGDAPTYLLETPHVPTGDTPRTYRRRNIV